MLFMSCVCHAFVSVHCWERAEFLALVCDVNCDYVTFPFGILGQVMFLIVSIPDPCCLSYFPTLIIWTRSFPIFGVLGGTSFLIFI